MVDRLASVIDTAMDPSVRAQMAVVLGQAETWVRGPQPGGERLHAHATAVLPLRQDLAAVLLLHAATTHLLRLDAASAKAAAAAASEAARTGNNMAVVLGASTLEAIMSRFAGTPIEAAPDLGPISQLVGAALEAGPPPGVDTVAQVCAYAHIVGEEWSAAQSLARGVIGLSATSEVPGRSAFAHVLLGELFWRTGRWAESLAEITQAISMLDATGHLHMVPMASSNQALVEAGMGLEGPCREHAAGAINASSSRGVASTEAWARTAIGLLELGSQRFDKAVQQFALVERLADSVTEPGWLWWQADAIEALAHSGSMSSAQVKLERLSSEARITGRGWAQAAAARCRAILGPRAGAEDHFAEALAGFRPSPSRSRPPAPCFYGANIVFATIIATTVGETSRPLARSSIG